jgi:hypothetical protein
VRDGGGAAGAGSPETLVGRAGSRPAERRHRIRAGDPDAGLDGGADRDPRRDAGRRAPLASALGRVRQRRPVVGEPGRYTALRAGTDGGAAAAAVLDLEIQRDSAYHVNVHRSASDMGTIVACGVLVEE